MHIGLDFHGTVSVQPKLFRDVAAAFMSGGHTVYILSAVRRQNIAKLETAVVAAKLPYSHLEIIPFVDYTEVPVLKLIACKRLGITLLIDDNLATCQLLLEHRITALHMVDLGHASHDRHSRASGRQRSYR